MIWNDFYQALKLWRILNTPHSMYLNGERWAWNVNPSTPRFPIQIHGAESGVSTVDCWVKAEGVMHAQRKSPRARYAKSNILAQVLNQSVVYLERRVESLAMCMPQLNNTCANFYANDLTLNAGRQRLRSAWAIIVISLGPSPKVMTDTQHSTLRIPTFKYNYILIVEFKMLSIRHKSVTCFSTNRGL